MARDKHAAVAAVNAFLFSFCLLFAAGLAPFQASPAYAAPDNGLVAGDAEGVASNAPSEDGTYVSGIVAAVADSLSSDFSVTFSYDGKSYAMVESPVNLNTILSALGLSGDVQPGSVYCDVPGLLDVDEDEGVWTIAVDNVFETTATLCVTLDEEDYEIEVTVCEKHLYAKPENGDTVLKFYYGFPEGEEDVDWYEASDAGWDSVRSAVISVVFDASVASTPAEAKVFSLTRWFYNMTNLQTIEGWSYLDTSRVHSMEATFQRCSSLVSLDLSSLDTSNVEHIGGMFSECTSLKSLNLSGLDFSQVDDMSSLFRSCTALESLNLAGINTSRVTSMSSMFERCSSLATLNLEDLDTGNVRDMGGMFLGCTSITTLDLTSFDTSNVTDMGDMFRGAVRLTSLDLSCLDTSNVTDMGNLFLDCQKLTSVNLSGKFNTSKVKIMDGMFRRCYSLASLDLSGFNTSSTTSMGDMFFEDKLLTSLDLSSFDTANVTEMGGMFRECSALVDLRFGNRFHTAKAKNMYNMFRDCASIASLDLSGFDTSSAINMGDMFTGCSALATVTFDEAFNFKGNGIEDSAKWAILPNPPTGGSYNGTWWRGSGAQFAPEDMQDLTGSSIEGTWSWATGQAQTYTVSYDANGGSGSVASQTAAQGESISIRDASALSRAGYRFVNWNTKPDGSGSVYVAGQDARFSANTTLYAQWDAVFVVEAVSSNWGNARVTSSPGELAAAIALTDEETAAIANGEKAYVYVLAADVTSTLTDDAKKKLAAASGDGYSLGVGLNVELYVRIGKDGDPRFVSEPAKPVAIAFDLPDGLLAENRTYAASRDHEGAVAGVESSFDGTKTMTVWGDRFSTYGIAYKGNPKDATKAAPKTGDQMLLPPLLATLLAGAFVTLLVSVRVLWSDRRRENCR